MGAALAFYTLLSLMPLLLVLISIAGLIFGTRAAEIRVLAQVQLLIGYQRAQILQALLDPTDPDQGGIISGTTWRPSSTVGDSLRLPSLAVSITCSVSGTRSRRQSRACTWRHW